MESHAYGNFHYCWYRWALNNDFQIPSIAPHLTACHEENNSTFPLFEKLLREAEKAKDPQHAVLSVNHGSGRLMARLQIPPQSTATTLLPPQLKEKKSRAETPTPAAAFVPTAMAPQRQTKAGSRVPSALHRFRCQAQKLGTSLTTSSR